MLYSRIIWAAAVATMYIIVFTVTALTVRKNKWFIFLHLISYLSVVLRSSHSFPLPPPNMTISIIHPKLTAVIVSHLLIHPRLESWCNIRKGEAAQVPQLTHNQHWTFPRVRSAEGPSELKFWASHPDTATTLLTSCYEGKLLQYF